MTLTVLKSTNPSFVLALSGICVFSQKAFRDELVRVRILVLVTVYGPCFRNYHRVCIDPVAFELIRNIRQMWETARRRREVAMKVIRRDTSQIE